MILTFCSFTGKISIRKSALNLNIRINLIYTQSLRFINVVEKLRIIGKCKQEVKELLLQNMDSLKRLSAALLEHKTLDRDQVAELLNPSPLSELRRTGPS